MIRRCLPVVLAACSAPAPVHPGGASTAPLSLAADAQMVAIPAGKYIAGSTPEEREAAYAAYERTSSHDTARAHHWFDGEEDRHLAELPAFALDLMPVTQAAYAEFVATGLVPAPFIDEAGWDAQQLALDYRTKVTPYLWHDGRPPPDREEHPVVLVTYREAASYCAWRGTLSGRPRRLPTAAEYEKAARGDGGLIYPWGNTFDPARLDSAIAGAGGTEPVGDHIDGASPYRVLGLAGNVFEWTSTPFKPGEMTVKGSAWDDYAGVGRGASRHGRPVGVRHILIGFRCAADG
jgi:formylglycine-generating enzyme required for sulfatase activity